MVQRIRSLEELRELDPWTPVFYRKADIPGRLDYGGEWEVGVVIEERIPPEFKMEIRSGMNSLVAKIYPVEDPDSVEQMFNEKERPTRWLEVETSEILLRDKYPSLPEGKTLVCCLANIPDDEKVALQYAEAFEKALYPDMDYEFKIPKFL